MGQRSETGYVRAENQDRMSWVRTAQADVYAVLDGMGGHAGGAIAAQLAVQVLQRHFEGLTSPDNADAVLRSALRDANETIYGQANSGDPATLHMGTTAVVLVAAGPRIMLAHVGDSRAYLMRRNGELRALTKDHSRVQKMVDAGLITQVQAASHPEANVLERALGHTAQVEVEVSKWLRVRAGESCLLCSDGLHGYVSDTDIAGVLNSPRTPQEHADELVKLALERGGEDNVTIQVIRYGERRGLPLGMHASAFVRKLGIALVPLLGIAALVLGWFAWLGLPSSRMAQSGAQNAEVAALASELRVARQESGARFQTTQQELDMLRKRLAALEARQTPASAVRASAASSTVSAATPRASHNPGSAKAKPESRQPVQTHRSTTPGRTANGEAAGSEGKAGMKTSESNGASPPASAPASAPASKASNPPAVSAASSGAPAPKASDTPASPDAALVR